MERRIYIDNLRLLCILLLFPYHAAMAWNCWDEGNYIFLGAETGISAFVVAVSPWYMTLLFTIAGMSSRYALTKRSVKEYIADRSYKLLLPLLTGTLIIVPVMAYVADRVNGGYTGDFLSHYRVFFMKWTDLTGYDGGFTIGHLWFLLYLFIITISSMGIIILQKRCLCDLTAKHVGFLGISALCMVAMALEPFRLAGKTILSYLLFYLIGYYIFSEENIKKIQKYGGICAAIFLVSTALNVYLFLWSGIKSPALNTTFMYGAGTFGILTLLSFGQRLLNRTNRVIGYLSRDSFLIYIFHFPWVIIFQFFFYRMMTNTYLIWLISVVCSFGFTIMTCFLIRKISLLQFLFGAGRSR